MKKLEVVVITGASAGVGRATARAFARRGPRVGLLARGRDGLDATRKEVEEAGGQALVLLVDVAKADQIEAAAATMEKTSDPSISGLTMQWHPYSRPSRKRHQKSFAALPR